MALTNHAMVPGRKILTVVFWTRRGLRVEEFEDSPAGLAEAEAFAIERASKRGYAHLFRSIYLNSWDREVATPTRFAEHPLLEESRERR